jgi:hypothetical protein
MDAVITLMLVQGTLGAADTLYYHEWRCRLTARPQEMGRELRLHAARDFIYAVIFATLPWFTWSGACAWLLCGLLLAEVLITLVDFLVERTTRASQGGLATGEFVTHVIMAIVYGAFLATLAPHLYGWSGAETGWTPHAGVSPLVGGVCVVMAVGVFASGLRDLGASAGIAACAWPWNRPPTDPDQRRAS